MQSFVSVYLAVSEKTGGQTDKQTNKQTNKQTDKPTKQLEGYSRHSRQSSLNNSHVRISHCYYIESKYSGSKTDWENTFFCKAHVCDHLWPSRSLQVTGHGVKWKSIYEFLSMNNCNYRPIWHRYWDIDMQHFCNHGYIFELCFLQIFFRNASFLWLGSLEITSRIILVFTSPF